MRDAAVAAHRPFDVVLSPTAPIAAFRAELASPTDDPQRPLEHIAFTVPYNMSEQPAASINCGWTAAGLPIGLQIAGRRHDDLGVLQVARAWELLRPGRRGPGPSRRPPLSADVEPAMTRRTHDRAATRSCDAISAAALDASERALWRMMSFYGAPLDDLDAAIAADPGWLLPRS